MNETFPDAQLMNECLNKAQYMIMNNPEPFISRDFEIITDFEELAKILYRQEIKNRESNDNVSIFMDMEKRRQIIPNATIESDDDES